MCLLLSTASLASNYTGNEKLLLRDATLSTGLQGQLGLGTSHLLPVSETDFIQGKGWPLYKTQEQKSKSSSILGIPVKLRLEVRPRETRGHGRHKATGDTRPRLGSARWVHVLQRTTLKRATALPYSIKKQFPIMLILCEMLSRIELGLPCT